MRCNISLASRPFPKALNRTPALGPAVSPANQPRRHAVVTIEALMHAAGTQQHSKSSAAKQANAAPSAHRRMHSHGLDACAGDTRALGQGVGLDGGQGLVQDGLVAQAVGQLAAASKEAVGLRATNADGWQVSQPALCDNVGLGAQGAWAMHAARSSSAEPDGHERVRRLSPSRLAQALTYSSELTCKSCNTCSATSPAAAID
mgnify:CR=1 FL=1